MDHPLYTISYVADIENVLVVMINRFMSVTSPAESTQGGRGEGVRGEGGGGGGEGEGVESVENEVEGSEGGESGEAGEGGGEGSVGCGGGGDRVEETQSDSTGVVQEAGQGEGQGEEEGDSEGQGEGEGDNEDSYCGVNIGPIPRMTCHVLETKDVSKPSFAVCSMVIMLLHELHTVLLQLDGVGYCRTYHAGLLP